MQLNNTVIMVGIVRELQAFFFVATFNMADKSDIRLRHAATRTTYTAHDLFFFHFISFSVLLVPCTDLILHTRITRIHTTLIA